MDTSFIRVCYVRALLYGVQQQYGITPQQLNIPQALLAEPMALIPFTDVARWLETIAHESADDTFMLSIAEHLHLSDLALPNNWFLSAPDLAVAVRRINHGLASFQSGASYYVIQSGKLLKWCYSNPYVMGEARSHDALRVAITLVHVLRHFLGAQYSPLKLLLSGASLGHQKPLDYFGCQVSWSGSQVEIWLDIESLLQVNQWEGPRQSQTTVSLSQFGCYLDMPQPHDFPKVLYEMINYSRYYGLPKVDAIAALYGLSRQQLQRRLVQFGFNFNSLCGYILSNQAIKYMMEGKGVEEISDLLGYANTQSFSRAFKRLRRITPAQYIVHLNKNGAQ